MTRIALIGVTDGELAALFADRYARCGYFVLRGKTEAECWQRGESILSQRSVFSDQLGDVDALPLLNALRCIEPLIANHAAIVGEAPPRELAAKYDLPADQCLQTKPHLYETN